MAWNYSGDPSSSTRDLVRFLIGDTVASDPHLADAEVDYLVNNDRRDGVALPYTSAVHGVDVLVGRAAGLVDTRNGDVQKKWSQRALQLKQHRKDLALRAGLLEGFNPNAGAIPMLLSAGGQPGPDGMYFKAGMHNNPPTCDIADSSGGLTEGSDDLDGGNAFTDEGGNDFDGGGA